MFNPSEALAGLILSIADRRRTPMPVSNFPGVRVVGAEGTPDAVAGPTGTPVAGVPTSDPTSSPVQPPAPSPAVPPMATTALPPYNTPGILTYLCRACGSRFDAYPVKDGPGTYKAILLAYGQMAARPDDPAKLPVCQMHACGTGLFGIGDVVGLRITGG